MAFWIVCVCVWGGKLEDGSPPPPITDSPSQMLYTTLGSELIYCSAKMQRQFYVLGN
jgi:hypothetical protein